MSYSAQTPTHPRLSFCMIVKNEEHNLERCLRSVVSQVDELVVVDTGSTDGSVAIAQQYGARVEFFAWCNDFAAARNAAIAHTTGDWVLTLDADEELIVNDPDWRSQLLHPEVLAYWVPLVDQHQPITGLVFPRLFRNTPALRYVEPYHETLKYQGNNPGENVVRHQSCIHIAHYGYEKTLVVEKNRTRDIPILEQIRQERGLSLLLLGTLADNYLRTDQLDKARECWAEAFDRLLPHLLSGEKPTERLRIPALLLSLGLDLIVEQQDYETASLVCRRGLEWFPLYPPLHYLCGLLLNELGFSLGAIAYFEYCLALGQEQASTLHESFDSRFTTTFPAHQMGIAYQALHRWPEAKAAFQQAIAFDPDCQPAIEALQAIDP